MTNKVLGMGIMGMALLLGIVNAFYLKETPMGYTSMSFEHSMIMLLIGWLIYQIKEDTQKKELKKE